MTWEYMMLQYPAPTQSSAAVGEFMTMSLAYCHISPTPLQGGESPLRAGVTQMTLMTVMWQSDTRQLYTDDDNLWLDSVH